MSLRATLSWMAIALITGLLLALLPTRAQAASSGVLCLYGSDGTINTGQPMMDGTHPAVGPLANGAIVAFQSPSGELETYSDSTGTTTATGGYMDQASSPSIASNGSAVAIAFNSASDDLTTDVNGAITNTGQSITAGGSPAVTIYSGSGSGFEYAFTSGGLGLVYGDGSNWTSTDQGSVANASTGIAQASGGWEATFKANTDYLYALNQGGENTSNSTGERMGGNLGQIAGLGNGDYEAALRDSNNFLAFAGDGPAGTGEVTGVPVANNTEVSIAALNTASSSSTDYEVAYVDPAGDLGLYGTAATNADTGMAMIAGSSPGIGETNAGYEVAYECAAPPAPAATTTASPTVTTVDTVTSTTPTPTPPTKPTKHKLAPRLIAKYTLDLTWNGHSSTIYAVKLKTRKLPRGTLITFSCRGSRADRCPKLGKPPRTKRTFAKELAVVSRRTFTRNDLLTISTYHKGYRTELISVRLPATSAPRYSTRWK